MLPKDLTRDIKTRLRNVSGQVLGIVNMLDSGKDPQQILQQLKAALKALESAEAALLEETFRKSLAIQLSQAMEACPGNCGQETTIEQLRKQFPDLKPEELTLKLQEIQAIYEQMNRNREKGIQNA